MTPRVRELLSFYQSENPAVLCRLASILNHGLTAGSGKLILSTVEDSLENGPAESFAYNSDSYDPVYHFQLAAQAGLSALVAPLGMLEFCARDFAGEFPWLMKVNHPVTLSSYHDVLQTADWRAALRLGAVGVSFTLPFGVADFSGAVERLSENIRKAKEHDLAVLLQLSRAALADDEVKKESLPLNQAAYGVHLACQMGAHIVSVPQIDPPVAALKDFYPAKQIKVSRSGQRMRHVMNTAFAGQRLVIGQLPREVGYENHLSDLAEMAGGGVNGIDLRAVAHLRPVNEMVEEIRGFSKTLVGNND